MENILDIDVLIKENFELIGNSSDIVMIPFSASASGKYFSGKTIGYCLTRKSVPKAAHCGFRQDICLRVRITRVKNAASLLKTIQMTRADLHL